MNFKHIDIDRRRQNDFVGQQSCSVIIENRLFVFTDNDFGQTLNECIIRFLFNGVKVIYGQKHIGITNHINASFANQTVCLNDSRGVIRCIYNIECITIAQIVSESEIGNTCFVCGITDEIDGERLRGCGGDRCRRCNGKSGQSIMCESGFDGSDITTYSYEYSVWILQFGIEFCLYSDNQIFRGVMSLWDSDGD